MVEETDKMKAAGTGVTTEVTVKVMAAGAEKKVVVAAMVAADRATVEANMTMVAVDAEMVVANAADAEPEAADTTMVMARIPTTTIMVVAATKTGDFTVGHM